MAKASPIGVDQRELIKLYREALLKEGSYLGVQETVANKMTRMTVAMQVEQGLDAKQTRSLSQALPRLIRYGASLLPAILIFIGAMLLGSALLPILGHYVHSLTAYDASSDLIAPIPPDRILDVTPLVVAQTLLPDEDKEAMSSHRGPVIVDAQLDYTNLSNWFEDQLVTDLVNRTSLLSNQMGEYTIEIPKLNIFNAVVKIGGVNLDESLIQYPGTSLPGKPGAPVVFGHSLLRQFYNPKESNPRRYNSIFSTIMTLEKGDKIYLEYADVRYTYVVEGHSEVKPTDTFILSQDYGVRQLKLVTCTPEGTYLRRGVVTAQLIRDD